MPLHIPITVYPSLSASSANSINATSSSFHSSPSSSPSSNSSSSLIEERFIPPTSSQGVWIRIKGYTQHLSPIGQRYARELPNKIGIEANQYIETLLEDREGVLKVEALRDGKVLAVVNSRLTRDEEEVFYKFRRSHSSPTSPAPSRGGEAGDEGVRRTSWINRTSEEDGRIRFNRRTIIQDEPEALGEEDEDEEDYSDLPPLVSLAPGESFYSNSTSTAQLQGESEQQTMLDTLFNMPDNVPESRRLVFSSSPHNLPPQPFPAQPPPQRDHLFYSHPNSSSYLPPVPAPASPVDETSEPTIEDRNERARLYGEPMDEVEDSRERRTRRDLGNETVVLRSMNRYTGWQSSTVGRETVGR
ncbi:hypothetical protein JCM5353_000876 [Sporobolomyces roseus]